MNIAISGSTGLIGSALVPYLRNAGHGVVRLVRNQPTDRRDICWCPDRCEVDRDRLAQFDGIIHLCGRNVGTGLWTRRVRHEIQHSRIQSTAFLCDLLSSQTTPPNFVIIASAVGYYGDRGGAVLDENSTPGVGFLAETCTRWEQAAASLRSTSARVVFLRTGVVLSRHGGALRKMLPAFRLGCGGVIGAGSQYMSWVSVDDITKVVDHIIAHHSLSGAVNAVAPEPVTNREFTAALGRAVKRPTLVPVPAFIVRTFLGAMGRELLLSSTRATPQKLLDSGFEFKHSSIAPALVAALKE